MTRASLFRRRPGFTVVELLVVISLAVVLLALGAAIYPNLANSQKVVRSADRISSWLLISKARAKRDGAPRGLRLYLDPSNPTQIKECQYIEAPQPWAPNPTDSPTGGRLVFVQMTQVLGDPMSLPPNPPQIVPNNSYKRCYFVGTAAERNEFDQRVNRFDSLYLPEYGASYQILTKNVAPGSQVTLGSSSTQAIELTLASYPHLGAASSGVLYTGPAPNPSPPSFPSPVQGSLVTTHFTVQSAPQTLMGEPILLLGGGTIIDWRQGMTPAALTAAVDQTGHRDWANPPSAAPNVAPYHPSTTIGFLAPISPTPPPSFLDILFSPGGQVQNNPNGLICLWVRDPELTPHPRQTDVPGRSDVDTVAAYNAAGEQVLVVINTRSGLISTQPVAEPPSAPSLTFSPYRYARDGLNTGL